MRQVFYSDISTAALALLAAPREERADLCRRMIREAELADRFSKRLGKAHPRWGGGTLREAAMGRLRAVEPSLDDPDYCRCLIMILQQLGLRPRAAHM